MNNIVKTKFDNIANNYDLQRKKLIPCFDDFYNISVSLLASEEKVPNILDIGAGTGILSEFAAKKFTEANFTLIDLSDKMLDIAKLRFGNNQNVNYIIADYLNFDFKEKYDIIISALSIHHLEDEKKKLLYKKLYSILKPKGIFVNADQVRSNSNYIELLNKSKWRTSVENSGLLKEEILSAFDRVKLDKESTLDEQLAWLKEAGFSDVDCIYKYYHFAVLFGRKY